MRDDRGFRALNGVMQAFALVLAGGHGSAGNGVGALLVLLLLAWLLAR